jgi:hypothetical protein
METTCPRVSEKCPLCGLALPEACPLDEAPPFDGPAVVPSPPPDRNASRPQSVRHVSN